MIHRPNRTRGRSDLFCYGTLQIPAVMLAVIGRHPRGQPAEVRGYGAFEVRRAEYPGLRPTPRQITGGRVYFGLTATELAVLDRFEGQLYRRGRLTVLTGDGRRRGAWVYVVKPSRRQCLTPRRWSLREFRRRRYRRSMQRFVHDRRAVFDATG